MQPTAFQLDDLGVMRVAGADASVFLQGQLSNDTRRLADKKCLLAAYSSPQGRVLAILRLVPHSTGVLAIMPRELIPATLAQLKKFVLRAKVVLADASNEITVAGCFGSAAIRAAGIAPPAAAGDYIEANGVGIARLSGATERYWILGPGIGAADADDLRATFARDWRRADIDEGLPQIYDATRELFVAQMLNLDLIDGISFTKGCYTGQEIIARTQHLGRIKRRMFALGLPAGAHRPGDTLLLPDGRSARLVEVLNEPAGSRALAVIPLDTGDTGDTAPPHGARVPAIISPPPYMPAA